MEGKIVVDNLFETTELGTSMFTIVIPAYERPELLRRALQSLVDQSFKDFKVIVIDDASKSDLSLIIKEFESKLNLTYKKNVINLGGSESRNIGIKLSNSKYIALLDSDDYWNPLKLEKVSNEIHKYPSKKIIINSILVKKKHNFTEANIANLKNYQSFLDFIVIGNGHIQTSAIVVEANLLKKILFKTDLPRHQDLDLYVRLNEYFDSTLLINEKLSVWDISHEGTSISRKSSVDESLEWIASVKEIVGLSVYYNFILKFVYSRNRFIFGIENKYIVNALKGRHISISDFLNFSVRKIIRIVKRRAL
jgi:glycosyltransferase involved in cell wall biosynthesis